MKHRISLLLLLPIALIALATHNAFAAQGEIIVAKSGGQFTSIQAAINSVTPSASNPYVIKVMPGEYYENNITMKSYIHLQGSGREVTKIRYGGCATMLTIANATNVALSDIQVVGGYGISITNSSTVSIANNFLGGTCSYGTALSIANSTAMINDNFISGAASAGIT